LQTTEFTGAHENWQERHCFRRKIQPGANGTRAVGDRLATSAHVVLRGSLLSGSKDG